MLKYQREIIKYMSAKEKRVFWASCAILAFSIAGLLASAYIRNTKVIPAGGGPYTEGIMGQPITVNPVIMGVNDVDRDLSTIVYGNLLDLAEEYKTSADGKIFNVILRKDLRWSDGEPLSTDDVLFTIETIQDPAARSPLFRTWQSVVVERLSERELRLTIKSPYAFFSDNLAELRIIPRHIFGNIPVANIRLSSFNLEPVGSGPLSFVKLEKRKDGFITDYYLKRNEYYFKDKSFIDMLHIKFYGSATDMIRDFNKLELSGFGGLNESDLGALKVGYQTIKFKTARYYAVFLNQGINAPLKEAAVRRALGQAVNRERVISEVLKKEAEPVYGALLPGIEGYDASLYENIKFSLEDSQKILGESGWKLGDDGIREKSFGRAKIKLEFEMVVPQSKFLTDTAEIIKDDWSKIGVKLSIIPMTPSEISENVIKTRNYHMLLFGNVLKNPDVFAFWHSSERFHPGLNLSLYENKKTDAALEAIRKEPDAETREQNIVKLQKLILEDSPAIFLFSPNYLYIANKNLKGLNEGNLITHSDRFKNVTLWYLKTKRVFK